MAQDRDAVIRKIQAMFAKAESTTFQAEAEAFAAKAQELMTAYLIEQHEVAPEDRAAMVARSFTVSGAYALDRVRLLYQVADSNGVFAYRHKRDTLRLFGRSDTIDMVLATFTILDAQLVRHVASVGAGRPDVRAFRHAFIVGFNASVARRLRERMRNAETDTPGVGLVLRDAKREAEVFFKAENPGMKLRMTGSSYSSLAGASAGLAAGRRADLGGARISGRAAIGAGR